MVIVIMPFLPISDQFTDWKVRLDVGTGFVSAAKLLILLSCLGLLLMATVLLATLIIKVVFLAQQRGPFISLHVDKVVCHMWVKHVER